MDAAAEIRRNPVVSKHHIHLAWVSRMSRLAGDGTAELVSRGAGENFVSLFT